MSMCINVALRMAAAGVVMTGLAAAAQADIYTWDGGGADQFWNTP